MCKVSHPRLYLAVFYLSSCDGTGYGNLDTLQRTRLNGARYTIHRLKVAGPDDIAEQNGQLIIPNT